jgi:hypothetical protein
MNIPVEDCLSLLHRCSTAALGSHSQALPGYPYVTVLPLAIGPDHCPWLLMSQLAEHYHNVCADPRASLLLQAPGDDVLQQSRMTLCGDLLPQAPEPELAARLLRYCPAFERYLALGDFHFFRFQPHSVRFIGGFGRMGWLSPAQWSAVAQLALPEEAALLAQLSRHSGSATVLGADCYGVDFQLHGQRQRLDFGEPVPPAQLLARALAALKTGELH